MLLHRLGVERTRIIRVARATEFLRFLTILDGTSHVGSGQMVGISIFYENRSKNYFPKTVRQCFHIFIHVRVRRMANILN